MIQNIVSNDYFIGFTTVLLLSMLKNIIPSPVLPNSILYYVDNYIIIKYLLVLLLVHNFTRNFISAILYSTMLFILHYIAIKIDYHEYEEHINNISLDVDDILIKKVNKEKIENFNNTDIEDFTSENLKYLNY